MSTRNHAAIPKAGALLLAVFALPTIMTGQAARDVKVVNTPTVHITNTPSVNVVNTPTVNVGNTPTVNVANTPNVSITNTAVNPAVVSSVNEPGRIPFQSTIDNSSKCSGISCLWLFSAPIAGHRIVIQHISGLVDFSSTPSAITVFLNNGSASLSTFFAPINGAVKYTAFDQSVQAYFDPGQPVSVQVNLDGGANFATGGLVQSVTVSGYVLDCTAAPCAAIAQ